MHGAWPHAPGHAPGYLNAGTAIMDGYWYSVDAGSDVRVYLIRRVEIQIYHKVQYVLVSWLASILMGASKGFCIAYDTSL